MRFFDFKYFKSKLGVQSKKTYLLTNLKLKVFKTYFTITNYVSHAYCPKEKGKLTELRSEEMRKIVEERVRLARSTTTARMVKTYSLDFFRLDCTLYSNSFFL